MCCRSKFWKGLGIDPVAGIITKKNYAGKLWFMIRLLSLKISGIFISNNPINLLLYHLLVLFEGKGHCLQRSSLSRKEILTNVLFFISVRDRKWVVRVCHAGRREGGMGEWTSSGRNSRLTSSIKGGFEKAGDWVFLFGQLFFGLIKLVRQGHASSHTSSSAGPPWWISSALEVGRSVQNQIWFLHCLDFLSCTLLALQSEFRVSILAMVIVLVSPASFTFAL